MISWEEKYVRVRQAIHGTENAFCKLCHQTITPKASNLANHKKSEKHVKNDNAANTSKSIPFKKVNQMKDESKRSKIFEIEMAVGIACHCAVLSIHHLGELMKLHGQGSTIGDMKMQRTKCAKILTKVVAPALKETAKDKLKGKKYSVLVDESTDVSSEKNMAVVLRYFDETLNEIATTFAGLVPVSSTTGAILFEALVECLRGFGLSLADCVGYGSDGALNMIGEHNSFWSRIKEMSPCCIQMRCICHSLSLCIQNAFEKLPPNLGFLLKEVPKWFSKSKIRREAFKDLFDVMNPDQRHGTALPFTKYCETRWLVRGKVMYNILVNWEELKAYFLAAEPTSSQNSRFRARLIQEMLADPVNFLYFQFATLLLQNSKQSTLFFSQLMQTQRNWRENFTYNTEVLKIEFFIQTVIASRFLKTTLATSLSWKQANTSERNVIMINERCASFLKAAISKVESRLPNTRNVFKGLSFFNPDHVLSQTDGRYSRTYRFLSCEPSTVIRSKTNTGRSSSLTGLMNVSSKAKFQRIL